MPTQKSKIDSLLGFAVKAGKVVYGVDSLETSRARFYLIFACETLAENAQRKVLNLAARKRVPVLRSSKELQYVISRKNCKVIAITDKQMAEAMLKFTNEDYHLISSEVK